MNIKFNRDQISSINNVQSAGLNKNIDILNNKTIAVPEKETFEYVLKNAKRGNEMAAVQLDEWQKSCKPQNDQEKQVVSLINNAVKRILR